MSSSGLATKPSLTVGLLPRVNPLPQVFLDPLDLDCDEDSSLVFVAVEVENCSPSITFSAIAC
jgi:hypothetical protein